MTRHRSAEPPAAPPPSRQAVWLRLVAALLALVAGVAALVIALLLVRSVLG